MTSPVVPAKLIDEATRLAVLQSTSLMDSDSEAVFDTIVKTAQRAVGSSMALISLVDAKRQWFKAKCGLDVDETPREYAFCSHTIACPDGMIVTDATRDPRFRDNPLVTGDPHIRMYAGFPLRIQSQVDGQAVSAAIGALCVIDTTPREISEAERDQLRALADIVQALFEARASAALAVEFASELSQSRQQSERANRQFHQAERMANFGSWRVTLDDNKVRWSDQVYVIHDVPLGSDPSLVDALKFYPPSERMIVSRALTHTIETGTPFDFEANFVTARGEHRRVRSLGELEVANGKPVAVVGVFQDVTKQYELEQKLRRLAHHDALTGLPNRARFDEYLDARLSVLAGNGEPLKVMLIDLDNFKRVNDECGHHKGDELLQWVAATLQEPGLKKCFAARLGGDEFVMIVEGTAQCAMIDEIVEKVLHGLRCTVDAPESDIAVSASIGISGWMGPMQDRRALLKAADNALYDAKRSGRNRARTSIFAAIEQPSGRRAA
ncbi:MAG: diguanylate cyclase [Pseudomonadota bacterium]